MNNPFSWNNINPALCYGRDALLSDLLTGLVGSPRHSFGIAGGRRMGKTTVLRRIYHDLWTGMAQWRAGGLLIIPLYIDGLILPRPLRAADVWGCVAQELQASLSDVPFPQSGSLDFTTFKATIQPILVGLAERPRVIVMFDEIEPILVCDWADSFLGQWRALLSNTPNLSEYFTAVFAGAREMATLQHDITSPLADILEWRSLRVLEFEDACALMQEPLQLPWTEPLLQRVYQETGGHPMLLQYIMQHVCSGSPEQAEQLVDQAVSRFIRDHKRQFNQWWNKYCTPTAQRIYARIPDDGSPFPLYQLAQEFGVSEAHDALEVLQHVGLVVGNEDELTFRYSGHMFRQWYRIYGQLGVVSAHDAEIYTRLLNLSSDVAGKYLSAWKIYQTELPNYSGAVSEMRDTLTLVLNELAPKDQVAAEPGFQLEPDTKEPTRRQRVRHIVRQRYSKERTKEIVSDYGLLETEMDNIDIEHIARMTTSAYRTASGLTHTTALREQAYRALKQFDHILAQLLPDR